MINIQWKPSSRVLQQFGGLSAGLMLILAFWFSSLLYATLSFLLAGTLAGITLFQPHWLRFPFVFLSCLTWPIGKVVSELALALMFYGVVFPTGLLLKLLRIDLLQLRRQPARETYWEPMPTAIPAERYFCQY